MGFLNHQQYDPGYKPTGIVMGSYDITFELKVDLLQPLWWVEFIDFDRKTKWLHAISMLPEGDVGIFYRQPSDACEDLMAFIRTTDRVSEVVIVLANPTAAPVKVGWSGQLEGEKQKDHRRIRNTAVRKCLIHP